MSYFASGGISTCSYFSERARKATYKPKAWECFYCGSTNRGDECSSCNAPKRERTKASLWIVTPQNNVWMNPQQLTGATRRMKRSVGTRFVRAIRNLIEELKGLL